MKCGHEMGIFERMDDQLLVCFCRWAGLRNEKESKRTETWKCVGNYRSELHERFSVDEAKTCRLICFPSLYSLPVSTFPSFPYIGLLHFQLPRRRFHVTTTIAIAIAITL